MLENKVYAYCATAFFIAFALVVTLGGNHLHVWLAAVGMLFAGCMQFLAQVDPTSSFRKEVLWSAWVCGGISILASVLALFAMAFT